MNWLVEFAGCPEAVIRTGSREEVSVPDDLGCPVARARPLHEVPGSDFRDFVFWTKGGSLRVLLVGPATTSHLPTLVAPCHGPQAQPGAAFVDEVGV